MRDFCFHSLGDESSMFAVLTTMGLTVPDADGVQRPACDFVVHGPTGEAPGVHMAIRVTDAQAQVILAAALPDDVALVDPPAGLPLFGGEWLAGPDFFAEQFAACDRLNARRDEIQYRVFTDSHGHSYDVHTKGRERMTGLEAKIANGLVLPEGFSWTGADNEERFHTNATFLALTTEILFWTGSVHSVCVAAKKAIRELPQEQGIEAIKAIEAGVIWP